MLVSDLCRMFGHLLRWFTTYTFLRALAPDGILPAAKIHFASKSWVLLYWQRYCMHGTRAAAISQTVVWYKEWNYGTFAEGATYIRLGGHHVGHRPTTPHSSFTFFLSVLICRTNEQILVSYMVRRVCKLINHLQNEGPHSLLKWQGHKLFLHLIFGHLRHYFWDQRSYREISEPSLSYAQTLPTCTFVLLQYCRHYLLHLAHTVQINQKWPHVTNCPPLPGLHKATKIHAGGWPLGPSRPWQWCVVGLHSLSCCWFVL